MLERSAFYVSEDGHLSMKLLNHSLKYRDNDTVFIT